MTITALEATASSTGTNENIDRAQWKNFSCAPGGHCGFIFHLSTAHAHWMCCSWDTPPILSQKAALFFACHTRAHRNSNQTACRPLILSSISGRRFGDLRNIWKNADDLIQQSAYVLLKLSIDSFVYRKSFG